MRSSLKINFMLNLQTIFAYTSNCVAYTNKKESPKALPEVYYRL